MRITRRTATIRFNEALELPPDRKILRKFPMTEEAIGEAVKRGGIRITLHLTRPVEDNRAAQLTCYSEPLCMRRMDGDFSDIPLYPGWIAEALQKGTLFGEKLPEIVVQELRNRGPYGSAAIAAYARSDSPQLFKPTPRSKPKLGITRTFPISRQTFDLDSKAEILELDNSKKRWTSPASAIIGGRMFLADKTEFKADYGPEPHALPNADGPTFRMVVFPVEDYENDRKRVYTYKMPERMFGYSKYARIDGKFAVPVAVSSKKDPESVGFNLVKDGESWVGNVAVRFDKETQKAVIDLSRRDDYQVVDWSGEFKAKERRSLVMLTMFYTFAK